MLFLVTAIKGCLSEISIFSFGRALSMSEGSEVSKVTICVKILKWHPVTQSLTQSVTKARYRADRADKKRSFEACELVKSLEARACDILRVAMFI